MDKRVIQHGIWQDNCAYNRRTGEKFPIELKFKSLLRRKAYKFGLDAVEFTYGYIPEKHISVITIVHPLDRFIKKVGFKIVNERLDWAERMDKYRLYRLINGKSWSYKLVKDGT